MCIRATTIGRLGRHHEENLVGCDGKNMNTFDLAEFGIAYNHISIELSQMSADGSGAGRADCEPID